MRQLGWLGVLLPAVALAQIEVSDVSTGSGDFNEGPVAVVVAARGANGKIDVELYKTIVQALRERIGPRLVSEEIALKETLAVKAKAPFPEVVTAVAAAVKAQIVLTVIAGTTRVEFSLNSAVVTGGPVKMGFVRPRKKVDLGTARGWVGELIHGGKPLLLAPPPPVVEVAPPVVEPQPLVEEGVSDVAEEGVREKRVQQRVRNPLGPTAIVLGGGGTSFRSLTATSSSPIVPRSPNVIGSLGFDATLYPFRLIPSLSQGLLADFSLEGAYRLNLVQAVDGAAGGANCGVSDDELLVRAAYQYRLGGRLPRIGVGAAWVSERTLFRCVSPALSTRYRAVEFDLQVTQPILGELLEVQVAGGPRVVFSQHASHHQNQAFSVEGWLTSRPAEFFFARAGVRFTDTRLTTWPDGVSIIDLRTFVGLEVGAAL